MLSREISNKIYSLYDDMYSNLFQMYTGIGDANYASVKIYKNEDGRFYIEDELPGYKKENLKLEYKENTLILSIIAEKTVRGLKEVYDRNIRMPKNIDSTSICATLEDGMLKVYFSILEPKNATGNVIKVKIE